MPDTRETAPDTVEALDPQIARDRRLIQEAKQKGFWATLSAYTRLSGPGWLQSAITLGGGSLSSSLYLGVWPEYVERNYGALVREHGGTGWDQWADLIWMYRALADADDAAAQFAAAGRARPEAGNSLANVTTWIRTLQALGRVDRTVTADCPLFAVFRKGDRRTYVVYNMTDRPLAATFSDGMKVTAKGKGFAVASGAAAAP